MAKRPKGFNPPRFGLRFALVALALFAVVSSFAVIAFLIQQAARAPDLATQRERVDERTRPLAEVRTGDEAPLAAFEAAPLAPAAPPAQAQALTGQRIAEQVCAACHATGLQGAPTMHDAAAWDQRLQAAGGIDGLVQSAIRGKNLMPPRGGKPALSDAQIRAAIEFMRR